VFLNLFTYLLTYLFTYCKCHSNPAAKDQVKVSDAKERLGGLVEASFATHSVE